MKVSVQHASEHFQDLVSAANDGQLVEIDQPDKPALHLVRSAAPASPNPTGKRILGAGRGELRVPSDEEWERMDREWRQSFNARFDSDEA
jgi:antitoxin (DNA-binding transcriptional repressor) of toxin-antitoxin stability system